MRYAWPLGLALSLLLMALGLVMTTVERQTLRLVDEERRRVESLYVEARERELQHYVLLARSALERIALEGGDVQGRQQQALAVLARLRFGQDGYFFAYDRQGRVLLDPEQMETQGVAFCEPGDPSGQQQAQLILKTADQGGGLVRYGWRRPASWQPVPKMSYVTTVEPWGWVVGAGLYLDEVESRLDALDARAQDTIARTQQHIVVIAVLAIVLAGLGWLTTVLWQRRQSRQRLYRVVEQLGAAREGEREQLGRELHDGVVQVVVSSRHLIEAAQQQLGAVAGALRPGQPTPGTATPAALQGMLKASVQRLDEALGEIRRVAQGMVPARLEEQSLPQALAELVAQWRLAAPFTVTLQVQTLPHYLPMAYRVALLRISQEAFANAARHAQPTQLAIQLSGDDDAIYLSICDDGRGFDVAQAVQAEGVGLRSLRARAESLGGRLHIMSGPSGTAIEVSLPRPSGSEGGNGGSSAHG